MPTICLIKDGKSVDFIVGFGDLGGKEDFQTRVLEQRIAKAGVIECSDDHVPAENPRANHITKSIRGKRSDDTSSDDEA